MNECDLALRLVFLIEILIISILYSFTLRSKSKASVYTSLTFCTFFLISILLYNVDTPEKSEWLSYFDLIALNSYFLCVAVTKGATSIQKSEESTTTISRGVKTKSSKFQDESIKKLSEKFVTLTEGSSRELRTIITTIVGYIGLLNDTSLTEQQQEYISDLEKSADNLTSFITNFTTYIKADLKAIEIQKNTLFSIESVFDAIIEKDDILIESTKIELYFIIEENFPLTLVGDKKNLILLLRCIVDNAIKFTSRGEIVFSSKVERKEGNSCLVSISISDTGIGIPKEKMPTIFKALNNQKSRFGFISAGDPGLGLPTADRMARLFDEGQLDITSKVNLGTTVTFRALFDLPEARKSRTEYKNRILIVASEKYAKSLKTILYRQGYANVDHVEQESDAIETLIEEERNKKGYDLVLLNVHYRKKEAIRDFIATIRNNGELEQLKVSLLAPKIVAENMKIRQIDSYIYKPLLIKQAMNTIRNTIKIEGKGVNNSSLDDSFTKNITLTVLIAEDDNLNRTLLSRIVEKAGHRCISVINGSECVETYINQKGDIDVIFMDYQMPLLDGLEATKQIRQYELTHDLCHSKIIGFTASENFKGECLKAGMDDCLVKPVVVPKVYLVLKESAKDMSK